MKKIYEFIVTLEDWEESILYRRTIATKFRQNKIIRKSAL